MILKLCSDIHEDFCQNCVPISFQKSPQQRRLTYFGSLPLVFYHFCLVLGQLGFDKVPLVMGGRPLKTCDIQKLLGKAIYISDQNSTIILLPYTVTVWIVICMFFGQKRSRNHFSNKNSCYLSANKMPQGFFCQKKQIVVEFC